MDRETRERLWAIVFRHRGGALALLAVPVILAALRARPLESRSALLGAAIAATGVLLRLSAIRQLGKSARVARARANGGIITTGPYRWTRNPLYLAAALMLCGLGLVAGAGWLALALFPAALLVYTPVVIAEERALTALFGDTYRRFAESVPRWVRLPWLRRADARASVPWREVFRREMWLVPGTLAALIGIAALRVGWAPMAALVRALERASGHQIEWLVAAAGAIAIAGQAIKVEVKWWRRRDRRAAARWPDSAPLP